MTYKELLALLAKRNNEGGFRGNLYGGLHSFFSGQSSTSRSPGPLSVERSNTAAKPNLMGDFNDWMSNESLRNRFHDFLNEYGLTVGDYQQSGMSPIDFIKDTYRRFGNPERPPELTKPRVQEPLGNPTTYLSYLNKPAMSVTPRPPVQDPIYPIQQKPSPESPTWERRGYTTESYLNRGGTPQDYASQLNRLQEERQAKKQDFKRNQYAL